MIQKRIKQSFRGMRGSRSYLIINVGGLAIAFSVFILIMLFVINEFNFDTFNSNGERVYRVEEGESIQVPLAISRIITGTFPEVEKSVVIKSLNNHWLSYENNFFEISDFCFSDNSFIDVFSVPFISGNPETALKAPYTIVLSESVSKRIFGNKNPIGQQVNFKNQDNYTVTGVIKDLPDFHLPAKAVASFKSVEDRYNLSDETWSWALVTYVLLIDNHDVDHLVEKMDKLFMNNENWNEKDPEFSLRAFNDIYLATDSYANDETKHGNISLLITLIVVAVFIILIASVNFINLTISRGLQKAKEIHIRKIFGSTKAEVIIQSMFDSVILCAISFFIAIGIVFLVLNSYENLIGKELNIQHVLNVKYFFLSIVGILLLGIIYGLPPALFLLKVSKQQYLRNDQFVAKNSGFNVGLITFQYILSIVLICGTILSYKQLDFIYESDLGFNSDKVLSIELDPALSDKLNSFKSSLLENPNIRGVSFISDDITQLKEYSTAVEIDEETVAFKYGLIDPDFIPLMDIQFKQGENFSLDRPGQIGKAYILNEAAYNLFKHSKSKDAVHQINDGTLIGVVKNFHFESLHNNINPMILYWAPNSYYNKAFVKLNGVDIAQTIDHINKVYKEMAPGSLCKYQFIDDEFDHLYLAEGMMVKLLGIFSLLAIFIASLGVISLSTMEAQKRSKEIGIRKVNGAKVSEILIMLNKYFIKWVAMAFVIASPIAYFFMSKWLENFVYKTELSWWIFALAASLIIIIALLTVSWQSWRAATKNPVEALRYE